MESSEHGRLPVYRVVATGIKEKRARQLAEALRIPAKELAWRDGEASFVDPGRYLGVPIIPIDDPEIVANIVRGQVEEMAAGRGAYWTMRALADDGFVGVCDLSEIDRRHGRAEIGFMLGRDAWGQGYALEAMRAVLTYAATSGLSRLLARTHLGNRRSDALLEKLGFEEEGLLRGYVLREGERRDCRLFGLLL